MAINAKQFSTQIVIPTLQILDQQAGIPYTDIAYYLVMGTIANESLLGTWLVQEGGSGARARSDRTGDVDQPIEQPQWLLKCWELFVKRRGIREMDTAEEVGFTLDLVVRLFGRADIAGKRVGDRLSAN